VLIKLTRFASFYKKCRTKPSKLLAHKILLYFMTELHSLLALSRMQGTPFTSSFYIFFDRDLVDLLVCKDGASFKVN
jgi:hypothetical protein